MTEMECDAIVFDLDGVLVNSAACVERNWFRWAAEHGVDGKATMRFGHGRPTVETIRLVAPHVDAEAEAARLNAAEAADTEGVSEFQGAALLLASLPPGTWAIATSGTKDTASARLRHCGLPFPEILVTADDVTRGKPDPQPYLLAATRLRVPPERCVVVEDAPAGITAGRAAGMRVIALATTHELADLKDAHVRAVRLRDLRILTRATSAGSGLTIRIVEA